MNENTNQTAPKTFNIIDGNTLMAQEYDPLQIPLVLGEMLISSF
jgi:hypothetical protein